MITASTRAKAGRDLRICCLPEAIPKHLQRELPAGPSANARRLRRRTRRQRFVGVVRIGAMVSAIMRFEAAGMIAVVRRASFEETGIASRRLATTNELRIADMLFEAAASDTVFPIEMTAKTVSPFSRWSPSF
jgi:hypothetical protein